MLQLPLQRGEDRSTADSPSYAPVWDLSAKLDKRDHDDLGVDLADGFLQEAAGSAPARSWLPTKGLAEHRLGRRLAASSSEPLPYAASCRCRAGGDYPDMPFALRPAILALAAVL